MTDALSYFAHFLWWLPVLSHRRHRMRRWWLM